jgi:ABC-type transport system involved in multi-copper enzyme maturation permease subunit
MQTLALFHDAYRELNSKRMFWVVLILSVLVVGAFGAVGINERGLVLLIWTIPTDMFNSTMIAPKTFYMLMFSGLGIGIWLTWVATVLALVSTAGIFPDFVSGGSISLLLSKPIGRWRLFLTKYLTGLLFVALQVGLFSVASFIVIGLRAGAWVPSLFLAIPIVVCFFSYLYSVCAVLGLLTRSTLAALLLTLLFWFLTFAVGSAELVVQNGRIGSKYVVEGYTREIEVLEARPEPNERAQRLLEEYREKLAEGESAASKWRFAHRILWSAKTALPKTTETIDLLDRYLITDEEIQQMNDEGDSDEMAQMMAFVPPSAPVDSDALVAEVTEATRTRPVWWIVGTSLGFEAVVLAIGGLVFSRRDY